MLYFSYLYSQFTLMHAISFEVCGGASSSPTGPERLPVIVYDAQERREIRPGPLLPDITRRVEIAARDNAEMVVLMGDYAFTRACAEVMRALMSAYSLWLHPEDDIVAKNLEKKVHIDFRPMPSVLQVKELMHEGGDNFLQHRHGVVYGPNTEQEYGGALCWTSSALVLPDGRIFSVCAYISAPSPPNVLHTSEFPLITGQEGDALFRATSDGRTGSHWVNNLSTGLREYRHGELRHTVRLILSPEETMLGMSALESLTQAQDADGCFALMYVSRLLAPSSPLPSDQLAAGWVDLEDVAAHIWPAPRSQEERIRQRERVYNYLRFAERAHIVGRRSGRYVERATGRTLDTTLDGPIWRIMNVERVWGSIDQPPVRVEIAVSYGWTLCTSHPNLAQYLPLGETLGAIPGAQPGGAWARVIGLALAGFWRRRPKQALDHSLRPTRRELLTRYTPQTTPPLVTLNGSDPRRALNYWRGALQILAEKGICTAEGEVVTTIQQMQEGLPRYDWQDDWLKEHVQLHPGVKMREALQTVSDHTPVRLHKPL